MFLSLSNQPEVQSCDALIEKAKRTILSAFLCLLVVFFTRSVNMEAPRLQNILKTSIASAYLINLHQFRHSYFDSKSH